MIGEVVLREVLGSDLPFLFEYQADPSSADMAAFPSRERDAFEAHMAKILADENVVSKTIVAGDEVAGNIVSWEQDGKRLIGYWLGKTYWGKGIATKAVAAYVELIPARPLHAYVAKHNVASVRVLEKCGFTVVWEGEGAPYNGAPVQEYLFELH